MSLSLTPGKASPAKSPLRKSPAQKLTLPELSRARTGLRTALGKCLEAAMNRLDNIWTDIGFGEEEKCSRTKIVFEHMQSLLDDMATEEEQCRTKLRDSMQENLRDYAKYCAELKVDMVHPDEQEGTLLEREQCLRTRCGDLAKERHARIKRLKASVALEEQLCSSLCRPRTLPTGTSGCPTLQQLDEWENTVGELAKEQKRRLKDLVDTRKRLEGLWSELEIGPSNEFEEELVSASTAKLQLTDSTQSRAEHLCAECEFRVSERNQVADNLRNRLVPLWDRLQVTETDREEFVANHRGCKTSTIQSLQKEVDRLEEIRLQNIGTFILSVRQEIHLLWDQCQFGSKQRQAFQPAYSDEFSEDLLSLHETELARLKTFSAENSNVYQLVERRDNLWHRLQEILSNANNPDRLSNRGGRLLKEEKMRKQLSKELPKVEHELETAITRWETEQEQPFQINDTRYLDSIESQWDTHAQKKEAEKTKRQQVKKATIEEEVKFGSRATTPLKRRGTATSAAAGPPGKRKVTHTVSAGATRKPLGAMNSIGVSSFKMAAPRTPVKSAATRVHSHATSRTGSQENCPTEGTYIV